MIKTALSVLLLVFVYCGISLLLVSYPLISDIISPVVAVASAWLVNRKVHIYLIAGVLICITVLAPVAFLIIFEPVGNSIWGSVNVFFHGMTLTGAIDLLTPLVIGLAIISVLKIFVK